VVALIAAAILASCGSSPATATPPPATPTIPASPAASPTPTVPAASLYPIPTSQFATPAPAAAVSNDATSAALQAALDSLRSAGAYPGVSAAVEFPDGSVWTGQSGLAVTATKAAVTADTLFSVGSISKTLVAALICRLAIRGTLSLDDPLSKYVPDFANASNITLRQLLNHTSGIDDLFDSSGSIPAALAAHPAAAWTPNQVLAQIGNPKFAPGAGYYYSNTDFVLLGLVIEKATGKPLANLVRSELLTPLGLGHTFYQVTETPTGPEAHGYLKPVSSPHDDSAGSMIPFTAEVTAAGAAGAYVSNASDLARWATALYGGNVLDLATLASMTDISQTLSFARKPFGSGYGFGFEETTLAGQVAWGHRGHLDGFWSAMWYLPATHLTVVVLTNADWADPVSAAATLAGVALTPPPAASPNS